METFSSSPWRGLFADTIVPHVLLIYQFETDPLQSFVLFLLAIIYAFLLLGNSCTGMTLWFQLLELLLSHKSSYVTFQLPTAWLFILPSSTVYEVIFSRNPHPDLSVTRDFLLLVTLHITLDFCVQSYFSDIFSYQWLFATTMCSWFFNFWVSLRFRHARWNCKHGFEDNALDTKVVGVTAGAKAVNP